ncbi:GNAT family N-acetyltransferase [Clostridium sp.]|uniref:GNAT family N-acetyltransferase n=1 Tax=Clostridium sp. TaxID=1506 RepID=UPI002907544B|nr:GNAT family N-acetyltransferase [Clostridium sp.]MDU5105211.1 GNAT family N-acetyltransferase [Clostridium sp.]
MKIRRLTEDNAREFWELRFRALREDGDAFGATYEEEIKKPIQSLIEIFNNNYIKPINNNFILGAFNDENKIIGVIGLYRETRIKLRHKATIWGMYIIPEYRRKGIAKKLLTELINIAKTMEELEQLSLAVVSSNTKAIGLYNTLEFITYGKEKNAIKSNNKYYDENYMVYFAK